MAFAPALIAAGGTVSALAAIKGGVDAQDAATRDAARAEAQAGLLDELGERDKKDLERLAVRRAGAIAAAAGASGVTLDSAPFEVLADQFLEDQRTAQTARLNRRLQAGELRFFAGQRRREGRDAFRAGVLGGIGTILGSAGNAGIASSRLQPAGGSTQPNAPRILGSRRFASDFFDD